MARFRPDFTGVPEYLVETSQSLSRWFETHWQGKDWADQVCRRWGATSWGPVRQFIHGDKMLDVNVLRRCSEDTGITVDDLLKHAEVATLLDEYVVEPKIFRGSRPAKNPIKMGFVVSARAAKHYIEQNFTKGQLALRLISDYDFSEVVLPRETFRAPTGIYHQKLDSRAGQVQFLPDNLLTMGLQIEFITMGSYGEIVAHVTNMTDTAMHLEPGSLLGWVTPVIYPVTEFHVYFKPTAKELRDERKERKRAAESKGRKPVDKEGTSGSSNRDKYPEADNRFPNPAD